jgi:hypothetical protein
MQHIDAVSRSNNSISAKPALLAGSICAPSLMVAASLPVMLTSRPEHHRWFIGGNDYGYMSDEATVLNKESRPGPPLRT